MIAKHVSMRSPGKSDFAGLVSYITDDQSKEHRLGDVVMTNCEAHSVRDAISEVLATQFSNTRAKSDKTFHLLVSFRAGDMPNTKTMRMIEERFCAGLGYGEHQRVSAVHHDTDNLHIHIAINKIHPTRNTIHEPYYPYKTLSELCETMERDYRLQQDNHIPHRQGAENRANDMERHAGIESLIGWIKRECLKDIKSAQSWKEMHQVLHDNGLELRTRGNGLVIATNNDVIVKASTLGRDFSKPKLEARFGPYEPNKLQRGKPKRQYSKDPVRLGVNTTELYARYKSEQQKTASNKTVALDKARAEKNRRIAHAKKKGKARRTLIKHAGGNRLTKKILYAQASNSLKAEINEIQKQYRVEHQAIYEKLGRRTWADWLKQEAIKGDRQALDALRARKAAQGLIGDTIKGEGATTPGHPPKIDNITKKGTIIYRADQNAIRDDGSKLQISNQASDKAVATALRIAMHRYGNRITVNGSTAFKDQVIRSALDCRLPITFTDPKLEQSRRKIRSELSVKKAKRNIKGRPRQT